MTIHQYLNQLDNDALTAALTKCCAATGWVAAMRNSRPYSNDEHVKQAATDHWWHLAQGDWLAAFAAHPKIGDVESLRAKFANTRHWAGSEQSGVRGASEQILYRLAKLNREYETRFGYIFIVCATGKSADEMLAILESRLPNDPQTELRIAAAEQLKITLLRLEKLAAL